MGGWPLCGHTEAGVEGSEPPSPRKGEAGCREAQSQTQRLKEGGGDSLPSRGHSLPLTRVNLWRVRVLRL